MNSCLIYLVFDMWLEFYGFIIFFFGILRFWNILFEGVFRVFVGCDIVFFNKKKGLIGVYRCLLGYFLF